MAGETVLFACAQSPVRIARKRLNGWWMAVAGSSRAARSGGIRLSNRFTDLRNSSSASRLSQALALLQKRDIKCALEEAQRGWSQN